MRPASERVKDTREQRIAYATQLLDAAIGEHDSLLVRHMLNAASCIYGNEWSQDWRDISRNTLMHYRNRFMVEVEAAQVGQ